MGHGISDLVIGLAVDRGMAAGGTVKAKEHSEGRRLARPVLPNHTGDAPGVGVEGDVVKDSCLASVLHQIGDRNRGFGWLCHRSIAPITVSWHIRPRADSYRHLGMRNRP